MENKSIQTLRTQCLLHKLLRQALREKGMSARHLSQRSGVPLKTIYHWSAGQIPGGALQIYSVAKTLDIPVESLLFGENQFPPTIAYELVLYRIDERHLREKLFSIPQPVSPSIRRP